MYKDNLVQGFEGKVKKKYTPLMGDILRRVYFPHHSVAA